MKIILKIWFYERAERSARRDGVSVSLLYISPSFISSSSLIYSSPLLSSTHLLLCCFISCCFMDPRTVAFFGSYNGKHLQTPIRDQGDCSCCWAMAGSEVIETFFNIKAKKAQKLERVEMSPQFLLEYTVANPKPPRFIDYNNCYENSLASVYEFVMRSGIVLESEHPYQGARLKHIPRWTKKVSYFIRDYVEFDDQYELYLRLRDHPVVALLTACTSFMSWKGKGIYTGPQNKQDLLDKLTSHAVLVVGFGEDPESNERYWIIKNSWGVGWGDEGYAKISINPISMRRTVDGKRKILNDFSHPINCYKKWNNVRLIDAQQNMVGIVEGPDHSNG